MSSQASFHGRFAAASIVVCAATIAASCSSETPPEGDAAQSSLSGQSSLNGVVLGPEGPLGEARVRIKGQSESTLTNANGAFTLTLSGSAPYRVVASKSGFLIAGTDARPGQEVKLHLARHPHVDNASYAWVDPRPDPNSAGQCANCHQEIYREWSTSAHAGSVSDLHFLNIYDGGDWHGNEDIGWNLLRDMPEGSGVCFSCHAPSLPVSSSAVNDLRRASGVHRQGVHCDYCHKVSDVATKDVGIDHGRFATSLLRPSGAEQLFFGPLDDVDRGEEVHVPLYKDSRYCAACHEGVLFSTHAYSTYSEWLASPSARRGVQCQNCHMAPTGSLTNFAPGAGGIERDPKTLASHAMRGADLETLKSCLSLELVVAPTADGFDLRTEVRTHDVGHCVPTGHPSRELILHVRAVDAAGAPLPLIKGPTLPATAGIGSAAEGNLAGEPGKLYAKQLESFDGRQPVPYWTVCRVAADTRLKPDARDLLSFRFARRGDTAKVSAALLFRRFNKSVADEKGWPDNELVVIRKQWQTSRPPQLP